MSLRRVGTALAVAASLFGVCPPVSAQGVLLPAGATMSGGFLIWADVTHHKLNLPDYGVGVHNLSFPGFEDLGVAQFYKPRVSGEAVSGGVGFLLPPGTLAPVAGSQTRLSIVGGYLDASAVQSGTIQSDFNFFQHLDGVVTFPCGPCELPSQLRTEHRSWRLGINATNEMPLGGFILLPSVELFGGNTRTVQDFQQSRTGLMQDYSANTQLRSTDFGARFGLGIATLIVPMVEIGVGGTLAVVHRSVNLRGSDLYDDGGFISTSNVVSDRDATALVTGIQGHLTIRPSQNVQIRAFGGFERDNKVPGVVASSVPGGEYFNLLFSGTPGNPVSIGFSSQTSYFYGAAVTIALNR